MKTRKKVKVSNAAVALCKTCGASVGPLQFSWHRLTCNGTNSSLNSKAPTNTIFSSQPEPCSASTQNSREHIINTVNGEETGPMICDALPEKEEEKNPRDRKMEELNELEPTSALVGFDPSENLYAQRCRIQVNDEDGDNPQNPTKGTHHTVCTCTDHDLISYLRVAVERQDIEFVVQTLRGREAWFKGSEETMRNAMQKLSRELDQVRKSEGEKLEDLQKKYDACLGREFECQMQYKVLEEKYESLLSTHKQTQAQLEDLEKRFESLFQRERDAHERLEGLMEISKEAFNELNEARIKVRVLENKYRDEMVGNKEETMEKMKDNEALNRHMVMVGGCETPKASQIGPIANTPCINSSMPKTFNIGIEVAEERGSRAKRVLFSSKEDSCVQGNLNSTSSGHTNQLGEKQIDIRSRVWPTHVVNLLGHISPAKVGERFSGNVPSQLEQETFQTVIFDNPASKELIADAIKIDESGNGEKEGDIMADLRAKENGKTNCTDIVRVDRNDEPLTTLGSSSRPSMDKCSRDRLLGNKRSFSVTKFDLQGSARLLKVNPIVISDTDSESSGNLITETPFISNNQPTQAEIGRRLNFTGSDTVREHSDHSEEQLLQKSAKTRRGRSAAVISDSESNSSDAAFSCKRRKLQPLRLETQGAHASEGIELKKQGYVTCTRGNGLGEPYCTTLKEDEIVSSVSEPYEHTGSDKDMQDEFLLSNKEAQCVQFRRLRRVKSVNEISMAKHCKKQSCSVGGEHVPVMKFRRLQGTIEANELPSPVQYEDGLHSVDIGECSPVTKFKRLKRVGESNGPEQSKAGEMFTCLQEQNTSVSDLNPTIFSQTGQCRASIHGRSPDTANKRGTAGNVNHADVLSEPLLNKLNCRSQRNLSRKTINLSKLSDNDNEEDEDESNSEGADLGGFIVDDDSELETNAESSSELKGNNSNTLDSENEVWKYQSESDPNSEDLDEILEKMRRQRKQKLNWEYEADMLAAFAKDPLLCMRAICALYRQQTNEEKRGKSSLYQNRRGFDKLHALRGSLLAEFLTENDPFGPMKKSVQDLEKHNSKGVQYCRDLAIHHSKQLFEIYKNDEDPHFPQR